MTYLPFLFWSNNEKKNASLLEIFYFVNVFLKIKIKISVEIVSFKKRIAHSHTHTFV
jgi:hypothetical protein